jgi:hypothetical protein
VLFVSEPNGLQTENFKAHFHYGENRSKLVHFKAKKFFAFKQPSLKLFSL